jgi:hypothetical protein
VKATPSIISAEGYISESRQNKNICVIETEEACLSLCTGAEPSHYPHGQGSLAVLICRVAKVLDQVSKTVGVPTMRRQYLSWSQNRIDGCRDKVEHEK